METFLHKMSSPVFLDKIRKYINLSSAELAHRVEVRRFDVISLSTNVYTGDNFFHFQFAFLHIKTLLKDGYYEKKSNNKNTACSYCD